MGIVRIAVIMLLLDGISPKWAMSEDLDDASESALADTKGLLANPRARNAEIAKDPQAVQADQHLKSLGLSPESQEKAYELSSELLEKYVRKTGGDKTKLEGVTKELIRDPSSLEKDLTPAQREAIRKMSLELSSPAQP